MTCFERLESRVHLTADMVIQWNDVTIDVLRADTTRAGPGWSSRALAMVHGAVFDAVNGFDRTYRSIVFNGAAPRQANMDAAIAAAAHDVLVALYPNQKQFIDQQLVLSLATVPNGVGEKQGLKFGQHAAKAMLHDRLNDGSENEVDWIVNHDPGHWEPDPMNPTQSAWGPNWGEVDGFSILAGNQFDVPPPPEMTSAEYAAAYNEVKELGALNSATRTPEQTEIGIFWAYDRPGTGTPPALYNQVVQTVAELKNNSVVENARLFALVNLAQSDAGIASWDCKYADDFWRPITGIRRGADDGNPNTVADENWIPLGAPGGGVVPDFTPPFPAYVSGHATFGAATCEVLRQFYGSDNFNFTLTSDELPGVTRSFTSFSQASAENARSRIYLGIHWNFDDTEGRALGVKVGDWTIDHVAQPRLQNPHHATPPQENYEIFATGRIIDNSSLIDELNDTSEVIPGQSSPVMA